MKTMNTALATGLTKTIQFGAKFSEKVTAYNNTPYSNQYVSADDFIAQFTPAKSSDKLIKAIKTAFEFSGQVRFKPIGYKANMTFYFN